MFFKLNIKSADRDAMAKAKARWDSIAKPIGSLGLLEEAVIRMAGIRGTEKVSIKKRAVIVMCADNGVVKQGVTQTGSEVTRIVAENMANGTASVCRMAKHAGADVFAVDVGMATRSNAPGMIDMHVADGTADMTECAAMTDRQGLQALQAGLRLVKKCADEGYELIATGEMGIGNTTTSSAVASVLLGEPVEAMTGRGAGLSDEGLERKKAAIKKAIEVNDPNPEDAFDVVCKVGGFDIMGLAGVFLGGAVYRIPVLIDGFISAVAALAAVRMYPGAADFMLASHVSAEPAGALLLDAIGLKPLITAEMHLGEGTGAVCAMPLLDLALVEYDSMDSFSDIGVEQYEAFDAANT